MNTSHSAPRKATQKSDVVSLLKADHRKVEALFADFEGTKSTTRKATICAQICQELTIHAYAEEKVLYPQAREEVKDAEDLVDEAVVEHASLKWLIGQLQDMSPSDQLFEAKVTVLKEYVNHHVHEEEHELFPQLKKSRVDLEAMGMELLEAKEEAKGHVGRPS